MLSMIFAFTIIAITTLALTRFAMLMMRWMLGDGQPLDQLRQPADTFIEKENPLQRANL